MSKELMFILIEKMYIRLNGLVEKYNFNLQNEEVLRYSKRLDKVLLHYMNILKKEREKQKVPF